MRGLTSRRRLWALAALGCLVLGLVVRVALEPLPEALRDAGPAPSLRVLDRHGRLVRELRTPDGKRRERVSLDQVSPDLAAALVATEDRRFFFHPGVDPLAMVRAFGQALRAGRLVSGASTITQQLSRAVVPRPRTAAGKLREAVIALRIEASLDKRRILEEYLSQVEFGPNLIGVEAASRYYFDKPAKQLDLAESATLVALVRGPSFYDPRRHPARLKQRRDRVLERLRGSAEDERIERALASELRVRPYSSSAGAEHLAFALGSGKLIPELAGTKPTSIQTTLDLELQHELEVIAAREAEGLASFGASALSVVVIDNQSAEVRAYLGSQDYFAGGELGGNDGALALRQPGSTLKPFVYASAMERLGWTPATLLSDRAIELDTPDGRYRPANYDGREHGPVRLRIALANSLNLPAVRAAAQVGPRPVLEMLHRFGFASLDRDPQHYGAAIALGSGEVRLSELAQAYSTLARDGESLPLRYASKVTLSDGRVLELTQKPPRRVLAAPLARQLTSVLSDPAARSESFGLTSVLDLPFPVAVKTGTSKGFRDNWTVGYTRELTVAVWVGNFDGKPMVRSSGVSGAGPLFHAVMTAAMRGMTPRPLVSAEGLVAVEVCALSGARPGPACAHRALEHFEPGHGPNETCALHELVAVDPSNGLRAGPTCRDAELRPFERYSASDSAWAVAAHRPLAPTESSPRCPADLPSSDAPRIAWPRDGARFVLDPAAPAQDIMVEVTSAAPVSGVSLFVDGRPVTRERAPFRTQLALTPGGHILRLGREGLPVRIRVDGG
jgi:penicillin-binding protein 1C